MAKRNKDDSCLEKIENENIENNYEECLIVIGAIINSLSSKGQSSNHLIGTITQLTNLSQQKIGTVFQKGGIAYRRHLNLR